MKTKFFSRFALGEEDKDNLVLIQEMDETLFILLESHFIKINSLRQKNDTEVRQLVEDSKSNPDIVGPALNAFYSILTILSQELKENVEEFTKDISDIYPDCVKDYPLLSTRIAKIYNLAIKYKLLFQKNDVKSNGAPQLEDLNASVIIKPVFEEPFNFDEIDIKEYKPKRISQVACVLIEIENTKGESINFQVDANEFERLLNNLIALQIELKTFENDCN